MTTLALSRAERVAEARRLRAQGYLLREVAGIMGVATQTVHNWLWDPDMSKQQARRARYGGRCPSCGARRDGSRGYKTRDDALCQSCRRKVPHTVVAAAKAAHEKGRVTWTNEQLLEALQVAHRDGICTITEWRAQHRRPSAALIKRRFGTWNRARTAAGLPLIFEPHREDRIDVDGCVLAVQIAADVLGQVPSIKSYKRLCATRPDLGLPSASLIVVRCGGWLEVLQSAFPEDEL